MIHYLFPAPALRQATRHNHTESPPAFRLLGKMFITFALSHIIIYYHLLSKHRILIIRRDSLVSQRIRTKKQEPRGCNEIETHYRVINDLVRLCTSISRLTTTYSKFDALSLPASALFFSIHLHTSELQNFYDLSKIVPHCDFDLTKRSVREDTAIPSMITLHDPHLSVHPRIQPSPLQNAVVLISLKLFQLPPSRYRSLCL